MIVLTFYTLYTVNIISYRHYGVVSNVGIYFQMIESNILGNLAFQQDLTFLSLRNIYTANTISYRHYRIFCNVKIWIQIIRSNILDLLVFQYDVSFYTKWENNS